MRVVRIIIAVLLTIALVCGCVWLVWFSGNSWRFVVQYNRYTLGNYREVVVRALLLSMPPCLIVGIHALTCTAVIFNFERTRVAKLRRICSRSLFGFAALLVAIAIWFTVASRGEGAGYVVFLTGPMIGFALVVPTSLGFIVAPGDQNMANQSPQHNPDKSG